MKNANVETKKIVKAAQSRRVAGVPVRSGVKAGLTHHQAEKMAAFNKLRDRD